MASHLLGRSLATELSLLLNIHFHRDSLFNEAKNGSQSTCFNYSWKGRIIILFLIAL